MINVIPTISSKIPAKKEMMKIFVFVIFCLTAGEFSNVLTGSDDEPTIPMLSILFKEAPPICTRAVRNIHETFPPWSGCNSSPSVCP